MNERLVHLIPEPHVPPKPESPDVVTASYLLPYFKWYVMKDAKRKNVSWEQIFDHDRPTTLLPNVSYKSRRHIEIKEKVVEKPRRRTHDQEETVEKEAFRIVAEAIVLEDAARKEGFNEYDPAPHLLFRFTLVRPGYKVNPRKEIDPDNMFARVFVDLGPEGAEILDYGDASSLNYERRFYTRGEEHQSELIKRVMSIQGTNPLLRFFTDPEVARYSDDPAPRLSMDHLHLIHDTFLPTEPQDGQAA